MELRHLKYFLTVAEELHFAKAAARLHISQPPLSKHIKELEAELGVVLFDRSTRRVAVTGAGAAFRDRVLDIVGALDDAVNEVREYGSGRRGRLRVGFVSSASVTVIPTAVRRFRDENPGVEVELDPLTSREQLDALTQGRLDVGLVRAYASTPGITMQTLLNERVVAVVPTAHRLASSVSVTAADLVGERLILFPRELMPGFVGQVWDLFRTIDAEPTVVQEAIHHETVVGLVSAGVGISVLPESVSHVRTADVALVPIDGAPTTTLSAATLRGDGSPMLALFLESLRASALQYEQTQMRHVDDGFR
ncbi:LysR family transcriptional regulator [Rhodococcoides fascians]|uniref:LysR family transcriptional regulator n=1 Tax=Rhodococcoides fascians TaxID=1828 RepID=UPI0009B7F57F|nr:LysR substrate-binding domain-containing protein [Rhodococcus fascians]